MSYLGLKSNTPALVTHITGDVTGDSVTDTIPVSLPLIGTPGTYRSVTTDEHGRVTSGTNPTTIGGYGITSLPWANVTGAPTTLAGYGITDGPVAAGGFAGSTWQNVTGSRSNGTTYTNSTSKPIQVAISAYIATSSFPGYYIWGIFYINGSIIAEQRYYTPMDWLTVSSYAIIPPGATYQFSITSNGLPINLTYWCELR